MDPDQGLHQRFSAVARRQPDHVAVRAGRTGITYGQLDTGSDRLAAALCQRGVRPGDRVGLCCGRGIELITGMVAILKAGGAYVPIDPDFPAARIDLLVRDSEVQVVLTDEAGRAAIPAGRADVVDIAELAAQTARENPRAALTAAGDA